MSAPDRPGVILPTACPKCGHALAIGLRIAATVYPDSPAPPDHAALLGGALAALPPKSERILTVLARRIGQPARRQEIIDAMYVDDPHGGPDNVAQALSNQMAQLRAALRPLGWSVRCLYARGYQLERLPTAATKPRST